MIMMFIQRIPAMSRKKHVTFLALYYRSIIGKVFSTITLAHGNRHNSWDTCSKKIKSKG